MDGNVAPTFKQHDEVFIHHQQQLEPGMRFLTSVTIIIAIPVHFQLGA